MNEVRQNKATKQWVIYATAREKRPHDFQRQKNENAPLLEFDQGCPFCPGNEGMLPSILIEMPGEKPNLWQTRVVPNKFPALTPEGDMSRFTKDIYVAMQGYGRHEVIIESPLHNQESAQMFPEEVGIVIETYHRRYELVLKLGRVSALTLPFLKGTLIF